MPLYEYECTKCGLRTEVIQKFSDRPRTKCPSCKGALKKLVSAPAIQFKGSGWYITDYGRSGSSGSSKDQGSESSSGKSGKSDAPKTEPKKKPADEKKS